MKNIINILVRHEKNHPDPEGGGGFGSSVVNTSSSMSFFCNSLLIIDKSFFKSFISSFIVFT